MREKVKRDRERCREDKGERIEWYIETETSEGIRWRGRDRIDR